MAIYRNVPLPETDGDGDYLVAETADPTGGGQVYLSTYPGQWEKLDGENIRTYLNRTKALLEAIPQEEIIGFPVGDGKALYYVASVNPLQLQHIPYGDAYQIPLAHMRGLRPADVYRLIPKE